MAGFIRAGQGIQQGAIARDHKILANALPGLSQRSYPVLVTYSPDKQCCVLSLIQISIARYRVANKIRLYGDFPGVKAGLDKLPLPQQPPFWPLTLILPPNSGLPGTTLPHGTARPLRRIATDAPRDGARDRALARPLAATREQGRCLPRARSERPAGVAGVALRGGARDRRPSRDASAVSTPWS